MLKIFDVGEQKKLNKRILVMVIISFFVIAFAIIIPVTFYLHDLTVNAPERHNVFADIDELNKVGSLELLSAESDVPVGDVKVVDKRVYSYRAGEVSVCAFVIDDIAQIHGFIRNAVGDAVAINEEIYSGHKIIADGQKVKYLIFNGRNVLIADTDLGQGKMYDFIDTIDDELTIAVYA